MLSFSINRPSMQLLEREGANNSSLIEIFHITPTRATIVQKSTKYANLTGGVFPCVTLFTAGTNRTIR